MPGFGGCGPIGPDGEPVGPYGDPRELPPIARVAPWGGWFPRAQLKDLNSPALVSVANGTEADIVDYTIPNGMNGIVVAWGLDQSGNVLTWQEFTFNLTVNGGVQTTMPPTGQTIGILQGDMGKTWIPVVAGDKVAIHAIAGGTTRSVKGRLQVYVWPASLAEHE